MKMRRNQKMKTTKRAESKETKTEEVMRSDEKQPPECRLYPPFASFNLAESTFFHGRGCTCELFLGEKPWR